METVGVPTSVHPADAAVIPVHALLKEGLEFVARLKMEAYFQARREWAATNNVNLHYDRTWGYLLLPKHRKLLLKMGMEEQFLNLLRVRLVCREMNDYVMNHFDHSSVSPGFFRVYFTHFIWPRLPMRASKGAYSRDPNNPKKKRNCVSLPTCDIPHVQAYVNFAESCVRSSILLNNTCTQRADSEFCLYTCQFCLPGVATDTAETAPLAALGEIGAARSDDRPQTHSFKTTVSLTQHHSSCLHQFFTLAFDFIERVRHALQEPRDQCTAGVPTDTKQGKALRLVKRLIWEKIAARETPVFNELRGQLIEHKPVAKTPSSGFNPCKWLFHFLDLVYKKCSDLNNADRNTVHYCALQCSQLFCSQCQFYRIPGKVHTTEVKRQVRKHIEDAHTPVECQCCQKTIPGGAKGAKDHVCEHSGLLARLECGPRDTMQDVISGAMKGRTAKQKALVNGIQFDSVDWSIDGSTPLKNDRLPAVVDALTDATTAVLGADLSQNGAYTALDVFVCVSLSRYRLSYQVSPQSGRRVVHIDQVCGLVNFLSTVCAPQDPTGVDLMMDYVIGMPLRLQRLSGPRQTEWTCDVDYTPNPNDGPFAGQFAKLSQLMPLDEITKRAPDFVRAFECVRLLLVDQIKAAHADSAHALGFQVACVAQQMLAANIDVEFLFETVQQLPLTFDPEIIKRLKKVHSSLVTMQNPDRSIVKTLVAHQRAILDTVRATHPGFSTSVASMGDVFVYMQKHVPVSDSLKKDLTPASEPEDAPFPFHIRLHIGAFQETTTKRFVATMSTQCIKEMYTKLLSHPSMCLMYVCGVNQVRSPIEVHLRSKYLHGSRSIVPELFFTNQPNHASQATRGKKRKASEMA